jgi:hypothetical protein
MVRAVKKAQDRVESLVHINKFRHMGGIAASSQRAEIKNFLSQSLEATREGK